ncbi:MAG: glutamine synthetase type III, partial [Oscillospiraceae bacterium]|nr:glutamine synthetase type III [Oscillospiraceae bacterium]
EFKKDSTDRNRTSPFAFTGNKFEFRMLGSAFSIAGPSIVLNTIVADELAAFADRLEGAGDPAAETDAILRDAIRAHRRILFNGNNYSDEWVREAEKRGLLNMRTSVDALPLFVSDENIELFTKHGIFTETEMRSRCEILLETYEKTSLIEAKTMLDMVKKSVLPAAYGYINELCALAQSKKSLGIAAGKDASVKAAGKLAGLTDELYGEAEKLGASIETAEAASDVMDKCRYVRDTLLPQMAKVRAAADAIEADTAAERWPYPTYEKLLFGV